MPDTRTNNKHQADDHKPTHWSMVAVIIFFCAPVGALMVALAARNKDANNGVIGELLILAALIALGYGIWQELRLHHLAYERERLAIATQRTQVRLAQQATQRLSPIIEMADGSSSVKVQNSWPTPHTKVTEEKPAPPLLAAPPIFDMLSIYRQPGQRGLFLARPALGQDIYVKPGDLCHGAFNAMTGGGKTSLERSLITGLKAMDKIVILADMKFAPVTEDGLDWRPIARSILRQDMLAIDGEYMPCLLIEPARIFALIRWLALTELPRRLEMRKRGDFTFKTYYVFLEEVIAMMVLYPDLAQYITQIIALGRELRVFLFTAAQNFLVKDVKLSGGARENFQTAYFLGGDDHSGALLLDLTKKQLTDFISVNKLTLGNGLGLLRNNVAVPKAQLVRCGWASNESVYYMLGRADNFDLTTEMDYQGRTTRPFEPDIRTRRVVTGSLVNEPIRPMEDTTSLYQFSEVERPIVIALYKSLRSIDKVLRTMKKSARYHRDAARILREENLT